MLATRGGASLGGLVTGASIHLFGVHTALLLNGLLAIGLHLSTGHGWLRQTDSPPKQSPAVRG